MASNCSNKRFEITIIGAGIGGLSAAICLARKGHRIGVLERHKGLSEYGAGIQVTPNAVRILDNWGLRQAFEEIAFVPNLSVARRYRTGETIGATHQNPDSEAVYGFPLVSLYLLLYLRLTRNEVIGRSIVQIFKESLPKLPGRRESKFATGSKSYNWMPKKE